MSDDYNNSWQAGWSGSGPSPTTNWDAYQQGKSIHDANQAELARQNQAWSQPQTSFEPVTFASAPAWAPPATSNTAADVGVNVPMSAGAAAASTSSSIARPFTPPRPQFGLRTPTALVLFGLSLPVLPFLYPVAGLGALGAGWVGYLFASVTSGVCSRSASSSSGR